MNKIYRNRSESLVTSEAEEIFAAFVKKNTPTSSGRSSAPSSFLTSHSVKNVIDDSKLDIIEKKLKFKKKISDNGITLKKNITLIDYEQNRSSLNWQKNKLVSHKHTTDISSDKQNEPYKNIYIKKSIEKNKKINLFDLIKSSKSLYENSKEFPPKESQIEIDEKPRHKKTFFKRAKERFLASLKRDKNLKIKKSEKNKIEFNQKSQISSDDKSTLVYKTNTFKENILLSLKRKKKKNPKDDISNPYSTTDDNRNKSCDGDLINGSFDGILDFSSSDNLNSHSFFTAQCLVEEANVDCFNTDESLDYIDEGPVEDFEKGNTYDDVVDHRLGIDIADDGDKGTLFSELSKEEKDKVINQAAEVLDRIANSTELQNFSGQSTRSSINSFSIIVHSLLSNVTYSNFKKILDIAMHEERTLAQKILLSFNISRAAIHAVGNMSPIATAIHTNLMNYFRDNFASNVAQVGGMEHIVQEITSDFELD